MAQKAVGIDLFFNHGSFYARRDEVPCQVHAMAFTAQRSIGEGPS